MPNIWLVAVGIVVIIGGVVVLALRRNAKAPSAPPGNWKTDAITPAGAEPRGRVLERVSRQGVLTQGVVVACEMAHADGAFDDSEASTIRAFILSHVPGADDAFADRILRDALAERISEDSLDSAIETIRALGSKEQHRMIVELLVEVAHADGTVHDGEMAFMTRVGTNLGLSAPDVRQLLAP